MTHSYNDFEGIVSCFTKYVQTNTRGILETVSFVHRIHSNVHNEGDNQVESGSLFERQGANMLTVCTDGFQEIQLGEVDETNMSSLQNVQKTQFVDAHGALHICLDVRAATQFNSPN